MEKISTTLFTTKELLKLRQRDKIHHFLLADGKIRGALVNGTLMVREMRLNFGYGILETYILGQAYLAAALLSANLKGNDRLSLGIDCTGPVKGLSVEVTATGEVRGHLKASEIHLEKPLESFDISPFLGAGFLTITKYLEDAKQPYEGKVPLMHGSMANDLAEYFVTSEQTPTAFALSIQFDASGEVTGAGGLFLQAMPNAEVSLVLELESIVARLPSLGTFLSESTEPETFLTTHFSDFSLQLLGNRRVELFCRCSPAQMKTYLLLLPFKDRVELSRNGPFPLEIRCHNCNSMYSFPKEELLDLAKPRAKA
jgi:molecular chaperone Hsp33